MRTLPDVGAIATALTISVLTAVHLRSADPPSTWRVEPLASPAGTDSGEAQLTSQGDRAFLSWTEGTGAKAAVRFAERTASGWSAPRTIASGAQLMVNASDVPFLHALKDGTLVAQWLVTHGDDPEAYDIRVAWSKDAGKTWSKAISPHHDGTATEHGFVSLFEPGSAPGSFGLVWLDGRATEKTDDMMLRSTTFTLDGRQGPESVVDPRVCECCQTAAAVTAEGPIVVYRDRSAQEIRDIQVSRLTGGRWSAPTLVHKDNWKIDGCPVNGPAIAVNGRTVVVAWFTTEKEQGRAYAAFSSDAGRTFGAPVRLDEASAIGRVQVTLLADGAAAASWIEFIDGRSQFRVRRITAAGARGASLKIADGMGTQYPRLTRRADELLVAWSENTQGTTRVRTARIKP